MMMNMSDATSVQRELQEVKIILNKLLSRTKKEKLNEAWFESFLFSIFFQDCKIKQQKKIHETVKKNDRRTATKLDLFIETIDRCFVFEETLEMKSANAALHKLIKKSYHIEATKSNKPYLLIGIKVDEDRDGIVDISMSYLCNTFEGKGEDV